MSAEGMIYPDEFISLFEKNGFIIQLDLWVFEEDCLRIRAWLDAGLPPVKVPMNCSRVQLKSPFPGALHRNLPEVRHAAAIH